MGKSITDRAVMNRVNPNKAMDLLMEKRENMGRGGIRLR